MLKTSSSSKRFYEEFASKDRAIVKLTSKASKRYRYVMYVRPHRVPCDHTYWSDVQVTFIRLRGGMGIPRGRMVASAALNFEGQKGNFKPSEGL
ncbi:hypothetical protein PIB30_053822 [Stylosanthes scabra]|uniref:Uncharacterized protein n=1 Tax=Stylosanthes scabra TaxID=79078 RepID=A0ABU6SJ93_9FABA|nr:hypothetical protein [Stylosanthes scabra]